MWSHPEAFINMNGLLFLGWSHRNSRSNKLQGKWKCSAGKSNPSPAWLQPHLSSVLSTELPLLPAMDLKVPSFMAPWVAKGINPPHHSSTYSLPRECSQAGREYKQIILCILRGNEGGIMPHVRNQYQNPRVSKRIPSLMIVKSSQMEVQMFLELCW